MLVRTVQFIANRSVGVTVVHLSRLLVAVASGAVCALAGCASPSTTADPGAAASSSGLPGSQHRADLDRQTLTEISSTRVFFAHRSVGADMVVKGLPAIYGAQGLAAPVVNDGVPLPSGSFGDRWLNQTDNPDTKIDDFDMWIRQRGVGSASDIAFMKLGYVDITKETDIRAVFDAYESMMDGLERDYPDVRFLHATVTVTRFNPENNAAIEAYNQLLREKHGASGRLIDLAQVLSTCSDGTREEQRTSGGDPFYELCEEYTVDGGHLNDEGSTVAARDMLQVIAAALPPSSTAPSTASGVAS